MHRKIALCTAVLFNRDNAVKASSTETLPVSNTRARNEAPNGDGERENSNSGAGSRSIERCSS